MFPYALEKGDPRKKANPVEKANWPPVIIGGLEF
jgi:hypothetical protein